MSLPALHCGEKRAPAPSSPARNQRSTAPGGGLIHAQLTASHNPAGYNGIKLCLSGAVPVGEDSGLDVIKADAIRGLAPVEVAGSVSELDDTLRDFVRHVHSFVSLSALKPLKIESLDMPYTPSRIWQAISSAAART